MKITKMMEILGGRGGRLAALAASLFAAVLPATAGIKYWDNPDYRAFDVDCYASGAVWNLDGIRNQGVGKEHSDSALTWVNCGSSTTNDVFLQKYTGSGWATASAAELSAGTYGEWTANGFVFKGNSRWRANSPKRIDTGKKYTIQFLVDASSANHTASFATIFNSNWDKLALLINTSSNTIDFRTVESVAAGSFASIPGPAFTYATAIANSDDNTEVFFSGTVAPTSGVGFRQSTKISGNSEAGYVFGGANDGKSPFKGTFKFFRYYQKALSNEEVAWNRVVDERRYFPAHDVSLPVTNAVVATAVAASVEPAGTYAVDGRHVFTAPRVATVGNAKYICTGYTLEEWDDATGDWGAAVFHARELSCKVEDADCVRITWKWMDGEGLTTYDVSDYVWDGLELFYDGICNVGTNAAHDATALTWKNLGSAGAKNDMFLQLLNAAGNGWSAASSLAAVDGRDPGEWTADGDGFALKGDSRFRVVNTGGFNGGIDTGSDYSLQTLLDVNAADQGESSSFVFSLSATKYSFVLYKSGHFDWRSDDAQDTGTPLKMTGTSFDYATAIANGDDNTLTLFSGTEIPTSGDGFRQLESITAHNLERGYDLGGYGNNSNYDKLLTGTIKFFRQYGHSLSSEELEQNRKVDDFRYFGKFAATDVIVQSTHPALRGNEPDGEYDVDGSHVFTAPASVTIKVNDKKIEYACDGCTVEKGYWKTKASTTFFVCTNAQTVAASSYTYDETAGLVRLTWLWKPVSGIRTAADYGFDDYSQAGLAWHYDGLYNAGEGVHNSSATTWKNLGERANSDLHWDGKTSTGHWTDDGYVFAGGPRFKGNAGFLLRNCTMQTLIDGNPADQTVVEPYCFSGSKNYFNFRVVKDTYSDQSKNSFCWVAQNGTRMFFHAPGNRYSFATGIQDFDNKKAMMFPDTTIPAGNSEDGTDMVYHKFTSMADFDDAGYGLGNISDGSAGFVGTVKNFRYYDRVLTEDELVRNRNADAVRYFGALGVTNVLEVAGANTNAYTVEGEWIFTAPELDADGKAVVGYYTEELDSNGKWVNKEWHQDANSREYTYNTETEGGKTIRLTWAGPRPGLMIIVR